VIGESGKINFQAIFKQFYKNGNKDWFVELEAKMTKEEQERMTAMMEQMKKIQAQGGSMSDLMGQMAKSQQQQPSQGGQKPPQGGQQPSQGGAAPQGGQGGAPAGVPGFGPQDPKKVAEQLKTSLEGIRQSAEFLTKAKFVK
jgi:hypothetical protein